MLTHSHFCTPTVLRRALGMAVLALALPLAACGTGTEPSQPTSSAPTESSDTAEPTDGASSALDPTGKWSSPEAGEPFLEFSDDGQVKGTDGCNTIKTTWEIDGDKVLITPFTTTQKACAGVDPWLSKASSATIEGNVMKVADSSGKVVGGLEKEDK